MRTVYRTKVDAWLVAVIAAAVAFVLAIDASWAGCAVAVFMAALVCCVFCIRYVVDDGKLTVDMNVLGKAKYDIMSISSITPTKTFLSAPAASLDRLELRFSGRHVSPLIISPKDKAGFISHLKSINPGILVGN